MGYSRKGAGTVSSDDHPNPCEVCMGRVVGSHGEIYTCDNCPIVKKKKAVQK